MADKTIGELTEASEVYDDSLLVMEQQGEARSVKGERIKKYAREATAAYVEEAKNSAEAAKDSADAAAGSARDAADIALHPPILKDENDHWWIWDTDLNDYKDSGIDAGVSLEVVEEVITGEPGSGASVENLGTKTDPRLQFTIPQGQKGDTGEAATIEVGEVTTGGPGEAASVKNSGTPGAAKLDFVIPKGDTGRGFTILGYYETAEALGEAVQDPQAGDAYGVGTEKPYDIYIYDADKGWVDNGPIGGVPELPEHLVVAGGDEIPVTVATLHDHDTGEAIAPRTDVKALSGEGKKWDYVGFTEDDQVGLIEGTWPCNQNLLINWYFREEGPFPINQRGETDFSYGVPSGYKLDKWWIQFRDPANEAHLLPDGLQMIGGKNFELAQRIEFGIVDHGEHMYTLSFLTSDGVLYSKTASFPTTIKADSYLSEDGKVYLIFAQHANFDWVAIDIHDDNADGMIFVAAKLEMEDTQTLAHKEGGKWVLNELPDYATELAKCQRYQYAVRHPTEVVSGKAAQVHLFPAIAITTAHIIGMISVPVTLRKRPSVIKNITGGFNFLGAFSEGYKDKRTTAVNFNVYSVQNGTVEFDVMFTDTSLNFVPGNMYHIYVNMGEDEYFLLDANL